MESLGERVKYFITFRWFWQLRKLSRNLSVRAALYGTAGLAAALSSVFFAPYVPDGLAEILGGSAVKDLLTIVASSMLAVVTFSLSTLVSAYGTVAGGAPPRATALVIEDVRAQAALSTFLGSFIFSIIALVALSTGYYGPKGRVILFFTTMLILFMVILTIVRWIGQLSGLSRLGAVVSQVETETEKAIKSRRSLFSWADAGYDSNSVDEVKAVSAQLTGFVQTVNLTALDELANEEKFHLYVDALPGKFLQPTTKLAWASTDLSETLEDQIRSCFIIGSERTFLDDPRFGFIVLSEIGSRALSPGINDPGTAIYVLARIIRLLYVTCETQTAEKPKESFLHVRSITAEELFDDAFRAISRDGAGMIEVVVFLQKALFQLKEVPCFTEAAKKMAQEALNRGLSAMPNITDQKRLRYAFGGPKYLMPPN